MKTFLDEILSEYKAFSGKDPDCFEKLKGGVSDKLILRIVSGSGSVVGVFNSNVPENDAFTGFTNTFRNLNLNVPFVLHMRDDRKVYFISDLGYETLFEFAKRNPPREELMSIYRDVILHLVKFQVLGAKHIDFNLCFETNVFDRNQAETDAGKFSKYYLQKHLNNGKSMPDGKTFERLLDFTINGSKNYFMYRDFQPRNIVINKGLPYFVDYQSGRLGPCQYDLISFLYSGSIDITDDERIELKRHFLNEFSKYEPLDEETFYTSLDYFTLLRIIQVLGSYCWSAYEKGNPAVLSKIPTAINNLRKIKLSDPLLETFREQITN